MEIVYGFVWARNTWLSYSSIDMWGGLTNVSSSMEFITVFTSRSIEINTKECKGKGTGAERLPKGPSLIRPVSKGKRGIYRLKHEGAVELW